MNASMFAEQLEVIDGDSATVHHYAFTKIFCLSVSMFSNINVNGINGYSVLDLMM